MSSPVLMVYSGARAVVYQVLTSRVQEWWTVRALQQALPQEAGVRAEAVRTVLYLLLANRIVEPVAGQRALTVRVTTDGHTFLSAVLARWNEQQPRP